jgi:hypothetical protein
MAIDPIVAEVRQAREAYAKQFNYDIDAMGRDLQERQQKSGRTVVALPPKRLELELLVPDVRANIREPMTAPPPQTW